MLTDKQREYRREAVKTWNIKIGATRSGKTYGDYFLIPKRLLDVRGKPGLRLLMGNTKGTLQRNLIEPLQTIWGPQLVSNIRSDNTATLFGEHVHCLGADNIKHVDRLRGSSVAYCYGENYEERPFDASLLETPHPSASQTPSLQGEGFEEDE